MMFWCSLSSDHFLFRLCCVAAFVLSGCDSSSERAKRQVLQNNEIAEPIYRYSGDHTFSIPPPKKKTLPTYPWEKKNRWHVITKEHFRCRGKRQNPALIYEDGQGKMHRFTDCNGRAHSLPIDDDDEHVYPILLELLNYIQEQTGHRAIVTCGHRCPDHNTWSDPTKQARHSKHQIGAEVDFYVETMEQTPQMIVDLLLQFYKERYPDTPAFSTFKRYERQDTNVSTPPWYNKEVFIKLFQQEEGRDKDNRHPYPYIGIQVRWDTKKQAGVAYSWPLAHKGYHRN